MNDYYGLGPGCDLPPYILGIYVDVPMTNDVTEYRRSAGIPDTVDRSSKGDGWHKHLVSWSYSANETAEMESGGTIGSSDRIFSLKCPCKLFFKQIAFGTGRNPTGIDGIGSRTCFRSIKIQFKEGYLVTHPVYIFWSRLNPVSS